MTRAIRWSALLLLGVLITLTLAVIFTANTQVGSRWLISQIESFSNDRLHIGQVTGEIAGPLELKDITVTNASAITRIGHLQMSWSPRALVHRLISIQSLDIRDVSVSLAARPPEPEQSSQFQVPNSIELPFDVNLESITLSNFKLFTKPDATPIVINEARLRLLADAQGVQISEVVVDAEIVELTGQLQLDNANDGAVKGNLRWQLRPDGVAAVNGVTLISGQLQKPRFEQTLSAPYSSQAIATVDLSQPAPNVTASLKTQTIAIDSIKAGVPPFPVSINAEVSGQPDKLEVRSDAVTHMPSDIKVNVRLATLLEDDKVTVNELLVSSADVRLKISGSGWVSTKPAVEMNLGFDLTDVAWPLRDTPVIEVPAATVTIEGLLPRLQVATQLTVATQPTMTITANGTVNAQRKPDVDIVLNWLNARWPLDGDALIRSRDGTFRIGGSIESANVTGSARLGTKGEITAAITRVDNRLTTEFDWTNLSWPLVDTGALSPVLTSPSGSLSLIGVPDSYRLTLNSQLEALAAQRANLVVQGAGDTSSFDFSTFKINGDAGDIQAAGSFTWTAPWKIDLRLEGDRVNPGVVATQWPGDLRIALDATATASNGKEPDSLLGAINGTVEKLIVEGYLRGFPVSADASGSLQEGLVEIDSARLNSGNTVVSVNGRVDDALDLQWHIDSPSLEELLPDAKGRLRSQGRITGSIDQPVASASLSGNQLKYLDHAFDTINIDADWSADGKEQSQLSVTADNGVIAGVAVPTMTFGASGTPSRHQAQLQAETSQGQIDASVSGRLTSMTAPWSWSGSVESLDFKYPELLPWQLRSPIPIIATADTVTIDQGCLDSGQAALCISGTASGATIDADLSVENLPLDYLKDYLRDTKALSGSVDGQFQFQRDVAGELTIDTVITTSAGAYEFGTAGVSKDTSNVLDFEPSTVTANLRDDRLSVDGELRLASQDGATFNIMIDSPLNGIDSAGISGRLDARIQDVGVFSAFTDQVSDLRGRVNAGMDIAGTVAAPKIQGDLVLADGAVAVPQTGVDITQLQAQMRGDSTGEIAIEAAALVGDGTAKLTGTVAVADGLVRGKVKLNGDNLEVYQTADASVLVNPDLELTLGDRLLELTGEVYVPRANINPVALPESAIAVSGDQVFVDAPAPKTSQSTKSTHSATSLRAQVGLVMGEEVIVDAFGLRGRLEGELRINESTAQPTSATGELRIVDGRYDAYGQTLDIERGRIIFAGGRITQPAIDVRALRRPTEDITVGLNAKGTVEQPDFTLFSEPAMTQRDQLSYLLLGESSAGLGQSESSAISRAEMALGLKGASYLADKVGKQFGIDTFSVETEAGGGTSTAALLIGKYLSPKLYVSYGLGLFGSTSTLRAQYTLSKNWKISTESSEQGAGGDFIYSIESGQ